MLTASSLSSQTQSSFVASSTKNNLTRPDSACTPNTPFPTRRKQLTALSLPIYELLRRTVAASAATPTTPAYPGHDHELPELQHSHTTTCTIASTVTLGRKHVFTSGSDSTVVCILQRRPLTISLRRTPHHVLSQHCTPRPI